MKAWVLSFVAICLCAGCAAYDYADWMQDLRRDYYLDDPRGALQTANEAVAEGDENQPLYLLERAMIHQRLGEYKEAQDDLIQADERLEILDFTDKSSETLAEFTVSPSLTLYRGQPHEKILVNTFNIMNFVAEGDLTTARIAARRAAEMYRFQVEEEERYHYKNALTLIFYGLVFEASGRPNDAYVAYRDAFELIGAPFLRARLLHIARAIRHSDLSRWEREFGELPAPVPEGHGTVLVVVMNGQTPIRAAKEIDVPAPYMNISRDGVSFASLGKRTIRYPELIPRSHRYRLGRFHIDGGAPMDLIRALDIESQAMQRFEEERPAIIAACVTRVLIRSIATGAVSTAVQKGVEKKSGKKMDDDLRGLVEFFMDSLLASLDVPDIRCWNLLPADVMVGLVALPQGLHEVSLEMMGERGASLQETASVSVLSGGLSLVQFHVTE